MIATSSISLMATAALVTACTPPHLIPRAACGETADYFCYGIDGGKSHPRASISPTSNCEEWTIDVPGAGTVLTLAKHINPRVNSSVLHVPCL
ncbi:uncharacterized protein DNG_09775 [Cephalotrichum gorgonifer]|uniref:Secreted protein n=1 Tax=Cephalotrichum gorgonifer TaxID=2041049 RepID=A0AAE8SZK9_9PEZI|nr:uncharacterized protein DNG_09775 [Cephalotrichum gorgonifer]